MSTPVSDDASLIPNSTKTTPTDLPRYELPDEPLVTIQPGKSWSAVDFREVWRYRELLYFLTLRDIQVRYKQTLLGVSWVLLQPLLTTFVFTIFLGVLIRVPSEGTFTRTPRKMVKTNVVIKGCNNTHDTPSSVCLYRTLMSRRVRK